jgi:hypothetical protein
MKSRYSQPFADLAHVRGHWCVERPDQVLHRHRREKVIAHKGAPLASLVHGVDGNDAAALAVDCIDLPVPVDLATLGDDLIGDVLP